MEADLSGSVHSGNKIVCRGRDGHPPVADRRMSPGSTRQESRIAAKRWRTYTRIDLNEVLRRVRPEIIKGS